MSLTTHARFGILTTVMKGRKPLFWIGSALEDLTAFPSEVKREMGYALYVAQTGEKHPNARPLKGFGGASTLEVAQAHYAEWSKSNAEKDK